MFISRRRFLELVGASAMAFGLEAAGITKLEQALAASPSPPVIWLQGASCSGCSVSLLNLDNAGIGDVLLSKADVAFHPTLQSSAGELAISGLLEDADREQGGFILVVEGGVPTALGGRTCIVGEREGVPWTMLEAVKELGGMAKHVVAVGTCASFGGIVKESAYTQTKQAATVLSGIAKSPVINLPGCPTHPKAIVGTLVALLTTGTPVLGARNVPTAFYGATVHRRCPRLRSGFTQVGSYGCYFLKGCKGPWTVINCPVHKWNNGVSWCIEANMACVGCASPGFPASPLLAYGRANASVDWRDHGVMG